MGQVTGINGSAIAGGLDSASVSSIASSVASAYTESAFSSLSSKADSSALSAYQPVSEMSGYATTEYVDGMVSGKLDKTAFNSADFYPAANPSGFITGVDLTPYQEKSAMTAYQPSGHYYSASNPSGFITGVDLSDYATTGSVKSAVSGKLDKTAFNPGDFYTTANESGFVGKAYVDSSVSGKLDTSAFASASAGFAPTGDYAYNSALTAYIPTSASGAFQPSGDYQTAGDYAFNSSVSSKLDASASGNFVMNAAMTSWIPYSALDYSGTAISGIGGSSLAGMGGGDYTGIYPVNVDNDTREIAVDSIPLVTDSSMTAYASAGSSVIGVNLDIMSAKQDTLAFAYNTANQISSINGSALGGMDEAAVSGIASAYAQSAASGKLDTTSFNSGDFYSTSNPSGFITGVDLTPYQPTSAMNAYATTAFVESGLSGKENVFSAGIGLEFAQSGSDRVLQVKDPVDIVAGPGIVIDNPDGNTLRVSVAKDVETILWEGEGTESNFPITLSESITNFERIRLYVKWHPTIAAAYQCFEYLVSSNSDVWQGMCAAIDKNKDFYQSFFTLTVSNGSSVAYTYGRLRGNYNVGQVNEKKATFCKIVGIHRIAGGN